jgi:hypothetical protein
MKEPFDIEIGETEYSVFPEEEDTYAVYKDGVEYLKIQKDGECSWIKLDLDTDVPVFEVDEEVDKIGIEILKFFSEDNGCNN